MKQIIAVVKPFLAERVLQGLASMNIHEISIHEVKGYGRQKNYLDQYADNEYSRAFVPKVEISVWVENEFADEVLNKMTAVSRTGRLGDGKIFVLPTVDQANI